MAHTSPKALPLSKHSLSTLADPADVSRTHSSDFDTSPWDSTPRRDSFSSRSDIDLTSLEHSPASHYGDDFDSPVTFDVINNMCNSVGAFLNYLIPLVPPKNNKSVFDAASEPKIALPAYFDRIRRYSRASPESIICAIILMRKVCEASQLQITHLNVHRLMVTAIMVFAKYYDDEIDSNCRWARIAGIKKHEINSLEIEFLNRCQFDLRVSPQKFHDMVLELREFACHPPPFSASDLLCTDVASNIQTFHIASPSLKRENSQSSCTSERTVPSSSASSSRKSIIAFFQPTHHHTLPHHLRFSPEQFSASTTQHSHTTSCRPSATKTPRLPRTVSVQSISSLFHSPSLFHKRSHV